MVDEGVSYENFYLSLKIRKRRISSIEDLRNMWLDSQFKYARQMRIISQFFLKRVSINYIFKSRIVNVRGHIKYRNRFIEVLKYPEEFTYVKANWWNLITKYINYFSLIFIQYSRIFPKKKLKLFYKCRFNISILYFILFIFFYSFSFLSLLKQDLLKDQNYSHRITQEALNSSLHGFT